MVSLALNQGNNSFGLQVTGREATIFIVFLCVLMVAISIYLVSRAA